MISHTTLRFRRCLSSLPATVRQQARRAYRLFRSDPFHAALRFKQVHPEEPVYSVRIGLGYRALGVRDGNEIVWFWVGTHAEYDSLLGR